MNVHYKYYNCNNELYNRPELFLNFAKIKKNKNTLCVDINTREKTGLTFDKNLQIQLYLKMIHSGKITVSPNNAPHHSLHNT